MLFKNKLFLERESFISLILKQMNSVDEVYLIDCYGVDLSIYKDKGYCNYVNINEIDEVLCSIEKKIYIRNKLFIDNEVENINDYRKKVSEINDIYLIINDLEYYKHCGVKGKEIIERVEKILINNNLGLKIIFISSEIINDNKFTLYNSTDFQILSDIFNLKCLVMSDKLTEIQLIEYSVLFL